ncbi:GTP-binding protein [Salinicoccus hispanicus]|uniref:GTP-binding protein n=2 Tax=Salinicoccus hispanicus TaxID=157225 RepID=A0A6N8TXC3_9STAP|nr:GTP-binding protein [Salinicoccus hispanicus]
MALLFSSLFIAAETDAAETSVLDLHEEPILSVPDEFPEQFKYDSGFDIAYPEAGVKGIYVSGYSAGGARMDDLTELLSGTALNAMVIDVKEDEGYMMMDLDSDNETIQSLSHEYVNPEKLMSHMEQEEIYPIARVVVFKDSQLAEAKPELSFTDENGNVWKNGRGESFVNPFSKEVWDYNVEVAKQAAKLGFKEIQFDYVRFPEGFENRADTLEYTMGEYESTDMDAVEKRVAAVTDFVDYAQDELESYDVDVSVDIFGYAATLPEAPGIGQNFSQISSNVDVISSMIYPSHWGNGYFEIDRPDLEPYETISEYMKVENEVLGQLEDAPVSRPWLQDFTASYLGAGNYKQYGVEEIEAQVQALYDNGVQEFLLWDASNKYTRGVDYTDDGSEQ